MQPRSTGKRGIDFRDKYIANNGKTGVANAGTSERSLNQRKRIRRRMRVPARSHRLPKVRRKGGPVDRSGRGDTNSRQKARPAKRECGSHPCECCILGPFPRRRCLTSPTVSAQLARKMQNASAIASTSSAPSQTSTSTPNVDPNTANVPRFAANLLSQEPNSAAHSSSLSGVDQTRFLQRVANAFQAAQDKDGEIRLRLSPPELGSMKLEIKVQDGVMTARMETESAATKTCWSIVCPRCANG